MSYQTSHVDEMTVAVVQEQGFGVVGLKDGALRHYDRRAFLALVVPEGSRQWSSLQALVLNLYRRRQVPRALRLDPALKVVLRRFPNANLGPDYWQVDLALVEHDLAVAYLVATPRLTGGRVVLSAKTGEMMPMP